MSKKIKSKAVSKLKNVQTVKQMLSGTHRSQTKNTVTFSNSKLQTENQKKRQVGEKWTDSNGITWEQKNGYRIKNVERANRISSINRILSIPKTCPNCKNDMTKRLDKKYYNIFKMCMDCSIDKEHKMRINGTFKEYERKRILENIKSWLKDAEKEKVILIKTLSNNSYTNSDGSTEEWDLPYNVEEQTKRIELGFIKFKEKLLKEYGATKEEIK